MHPFIPEIINLLKQPPNARNNGIILQKAPFLKNKDFEEIIIAISEKNLFLAGQIMKKCKRNETLINVLTEKANTIAQQAKQQQKVLVEAILFLILYGKYETASNLIWIKDKNTEEFKNKNLLYLQNLETEDIEAGVIAILIGLAPDYATSLQFFETMPYLGIESETSCYANLIGKSPDYPTALAWYEKLQEDNLTPIVEVYHNLIGQSPDYLTALAWYKTLQEENLTPIVNVYDNLIYISPDYPTALAWYKKLQEENLTPDVGVYGNLISQSPDYPTALAWYKKLQEENLTPYVHNYHNLIASCLKIKDANNRYKTAKKYFEEKMKVLPDEPFAIVAYEFMMDYSLSYRQAKDYFLEMEKAGITADEQAWEFLFIKAKGFLEKEDFRKMKKERGINTQALSKKEEAEFLKKMETFLKQKPKNDFRF